MSAAETPWWPQSADAERGVLSSILLCPVDVAAICAEAGVTAEWFFSPAHATIWTAIGTLIAEDRAVDFITLATRLRDAGTLDQCGGGPYLNELWMFLPSAANVRHYLDTLEAKWHLRRASTTAMRVLEMAKAGEDAAVVVEHMEAAAMAVRENRYRRTAGSMRELAMQTVKAIELLYEQKGRITGIETGLTELDKLTNGAHPEEMTIIAARPSVGKTALAMNIAEHMAGSGVRCLFFSGEMSRAQLGQRLICQIARVNHSKVRQGFLLDRELSAIAQAAAVMAKLPLVIDDTSSPAIEYIVGVCRRARRQAPDCRMAVFVDYAGLCTTASPMAKTRQLELGCISRGAKALSKQIAAPVFLLSQLNRESSKEGRRPRLTDLRECLSVRDSFLFTNSGVQRNMPSRMNTYSLNKAEVTAAESTNIPKGKAKTITVVLSSGRSVTCTKKHLFLTDRGWVQAAKLDRSHAIASARRLKEPNGTNYIPESKWIGWMLGNGSMVGYASPSFICSCEDVAKEFIDRTQSLFGVTPKPHAHRCATVFQYDITASTVRTPEGNPMRSWLKAHDLWGRKAPEKVIPQWWMESADDRSIAEMLAGLIETDGSVFKSPRPTIKFSSTSRDLILQVLWCFARLGVFARVDEGAMNEKSTVPCYCITICEGMEINRVRAAIRLTGRKGRILDELNVSLRGNFHSDRLGVWVSKAIGELRKKRNLSWKELGYRDQGKRISQIDLQRTIDRLNELGVEVPVEITRLVQPYLVWDRLKRIDDAGVRDVFDRNAPAGANFVCNGVIVHNSGDLEQDADNVFLLHRPEMELDPEDPEREKLAGVADLLIAKQRNGPVGESVPLTFLKEFTRFEDRSFSNT